MVSRVTRELSALIFLHQPIPVDINVDPVHQDTLEMELNVLVGSFTFSRDEVEFWTKINSVTCSR